MFIDSSALVALLGKEPDYLRIASEIGTASLRRTTAVVRLESAMVLSTMMNVEAQTANAAISAFFNEADIAVLPVTDVMAQLAVTAFSRYGKGCGHPARLNMADCLIYAAAKGANAPLLFIGNDFSQTDIKSVLADPRPKRGK